MTTIRELVHRWKQEPGAAILQRINKWAFGAQMLKHGHVAEELLVLLEGLPYREEVPDGKDLRGAELSGGVRELNLQGYDFSYARLGMNIVACDLTNTRFDEATGNGVLLTTTLRSASFRGAKLRRCFLQNTLAHNCCFDDATLAGASFENADLRGSSFRGANCERAVFLGANLVGCDFSRANLEEATFQQVQLDKSTNLSGASLVNLYAQERRDNSGRLFARATDWRQATYDTTTVYGSDPRAMVLNILDSAISVVEGEEDPLLQHLYVALETCKAQTQQKYQANWFDTLLDGMSSEEAREMEGIMGKLFQHG